MYSYRSLVLWQRAHALARLAFAVTDQSYHPRARALFDQIRRAAVSVEANIVEGYALRTKALFGRHLRITLGSAAETECLVRLARELRYLPDTSAAQLEELAGQCMRILRAMLSRRESERPPTPQALRTTRS